MQPRGTPEERDFLKKGLQYSFIIRIISGNAYVSVSGTTEELALGPDANLTSIVQSCIDALTEGFILIKGADCPGGLTHKSGVVVVSELNGIRTFTGRYAHVGQPGIAFDQPVLRFVPTEEWGKPILEWRDMNLNRIAWLAAHYKKDLVEVHQHISIETSKADGSLTTRFEITYGANQATARFTDTDLELAGKLTLLRALTGVYVSTSTTPYNMGVSDFFLSVDASGGAKVVNLPTASGLNGRIYIVKKADASANTVTITPSGAETIDGAASYVLNAQYKYVSLIARGASGWFIWGSN